MQEYEIEFYDKADGSEPAKEFILSLDKKMQAKNVDMMLMTSAVKVGSQGAVKFNGKEIPDDFNVYEQDLGFIRRQLETDPEEGFRSQLGS